jgi:hypothetical protein
MVGEMGMAVHTCGSRHLALLPYLPGRTLLPEPETSREGTFQISRHARQCSVGEAAD